MRAVEKYLSKLPAPLIDTEPNSDLGIVVTIPAFNEAETIKSLKALLDCDLPRCSVEILVNVNFSAQASYPEKVFNRSAFKILDQYAKLNSNHRIKIHILYFPDQNPKVAGVGWARKQIMDEAFRRLLVNGNENGIITGFDADSNCQKNYFVAIEEFFQNNAKATACSIHFEHPISGTKYPNSIYKAIVLYELHLRYFINAQKQMGLPFAYQTVGSSFAVRAESYAQVNGMSPKKAGEDFYFLQKVIALGHFKALNTTCVYPSPRISNRVGFGTGPSVGEISESGIKLTYNYQSFLEINRLYNALEKLYYQKIKLEDIGLAQPFDAYLIKQKAEIAIQNLRKNNKSFDKFKAGFMQWFGAFQLLKVLNILRATDTFSDQDIISAVNQLNMIPPSHSPKHLLEQLRVLDKQS